MSLIRCEWILLSILWSRVHIGVIPPDQVALPDLGLAAMENWGLVTYQEGSLLYEEGVSSLLHKDTIAFLIAHELAHQVRGTLTKLSMTHTHGSRHQLGSLFMSLLIT